MRRKKHSKLLHNLKGVCKAIRKSLWQVNLQRLWCLPGTGLPECPRCSHHWCRWWGELQRRDLSGSGWVSESSTHPSPQSCCRSAALHSPGQHRPSVHWATCASSATLLSDSFFQIKFIGVTLLTNLYRFQVYSSTMHELYIALRAHHPKVKSCLTVYRPPLPLLSPILLASGNQHPVVQVYEFLFILLAHLLVSVLYPTYK